VGESGRRGQWIMKWFFGENPAGSDGVGTLHLRNMNGFLTRNPPKKKKRKKKKERKKQEEEEARI
jgi:hypothetical protein